jgi:NTP pyrophosphatase (non-canonical NTP hydrolase)
MTDLSILQKLIVVFRDKRDWKKFHSPKNLAESLILEAGEVLEYFQWKNDEEINQYLKNNKKAFSYELADVLNYLLLLANETDIDLEEALISKLKVNETKYPIEKSKGKNTKYNKL